MKRLLVRVPATTANLGPGFDSLGLALCLFNTVEVCRLSSGDPEALRSEDSHSITGEGAETLPRGPNNLVRRAMNVLAECAGRELPPVNIAQINAIPLARGLGSSSAAIVGGCLAANELLGRPFHQQDLLAIATEIEGHPDNVAPALLGGLTVCHVREAGVGCVRVEPVDPPRVVVAIPEYEVSTEMARQVLPKRVSHIEAVRNIGNAAAIVAAFATGRYEVLGTAMTDWLHQPYRAPLIRGMAETIAAALEAGALGAALSGSGPSIIAFAKGNEESVARAMQQTLAEASVTAASLVLDISREGATMVIAS
ncbi:MAG: homoserine kinase [Candidatus Zipacnadales bacterium]